MTEHHDRSSIDLEKELTRYMIERRVSRRYLLERIALVGGAAALAPVIAACSTGGGSAAPSAAATPAGSAPGASSAPSSASPAPAASPEGELNILNWTDYLADEVISSFEDLHGTKVTQSFFSTTDEMYAKLGDDGGDYDISFPISVDVPNMIEKGTLAKLDKSLSDPLLFNKDPAKAASVSKKRAEAARKLEAAEKTWLAASEAYENANV